ncbi:MAG: phosphoserine phosphatase SerB [Janthinobacterium lividum]
MSFFLTLVAARDAGLPASLVTRVRDAVRGRNPVALSPNEAADIACKDRPDPSVVHAALEDAPVDALVTRARGRRKGLLVADMDGTIVDGETLDRLAADAGVGDEVTAISHRCIDGEIDFAQAMRDRLALLRGIPLATVARAVAEVRLTPGARTLVATMRAHNASTALVSGGFTLFTAHVASLCGFDEHRGNVLHESDGLLTGTLEEPVLDGPAKLDALRALREARGLRPAATLAVGDGANDLPMLREAGMAVAFRARDIVNREIGNQVRHADLRALLFAQGYPASVFRNE